MEQITNYIVIFFYLFSLAFYLLYSFFIVYHLARFGVGVQPKILALFFFIGALVLIIPSFILFSSLNPTLAINAFLEKTSTLQMPFNTIK
ncbi:MAG: hypothetical protein WCO84_03000 [bacterium]